jgi:hypothetical protein
VKRLLAITLAASALALGLGACDWENGHGRSYRGGRYARGYVDPCRRFNSCSSCTPVLGCGWCSTRRRGACVSAPDECAGADQFSWTWEAAYCPTSAVRDAGEANDASVDSADGSALDAGVE